MAKKANNPAKLISAARRRLIEGAAVVGYASANAFEGGVTLAKAIGPHKQALADAGVQYQAGYVARSLFADKAYQRKWGNYDDAARIEAGLIIMGRATPESTKADRRSELEHKACRAAAVSWSGCKSRAGVVEKTTRKPRVPSSGLSKNAQLVVPVDLVKASPKLASKSAANDYFATACAALLATVDKNAKHVMPQISSALTDLRLALVAAGVMEAPAK